MDSHHSYLVSGDGNVIEPDGSVLSIGSGAGYAQAAAEALISCEIKSPSEIVKRSLDIAANMCIYTNHNITVMEL